MVRLTRERIRPEELMAAVASPRAGAVATFDGRVRNHAEGRRVRSLYYEAYEPMALQEMESICQEACRRWPLEGVAAVHRLGTLEIGESSVFIAVSSAHRADAFEACRFIIDRVKQSVPIWKKEFWDEGSGWVEPPPGEPA